MTLDRAIIIAGAIVVITSRFSVLLTDPLTSPSDF